MNTEITDTLNGRVFFDADCVLCDRLARWFGPGLHRRGFDLVPLQIPWAAPVLKATPARLREEMHLLCADGRILCGVEAYLEFARRGRLSRWLIPLARVRLIYAGLNRLYRHTAAHRHCHGGTCKVAPPARHRTITFLEMP